MDNGSIRRILAGDSFTWADWESQPPVGWDEIGSKHVVVRHDRDHAHAAWLVSQQWLNDDDIRERDAGYAEMKKRQLSELLKQMERGGTSGSSESFYTGKR